MAPKATVPIPIAVTIVPIIEPTIPNENNEIPVDMAPLPFKIDPIPPPIEEPSALDANPTVPPNIKEAPSPAPTPVAISTAPTNICIPLISQSHQALPDSSVFEIGLLLQ